MAGGFAWTGCSEGISVSLLSQTQGLQIRMDFNTHKKFVRLDDGTEDPSTKSVVVPAPEVREIDEADKLAKIISDTLLSK